jgi:hypothetical protein
MWLGYCIGLVPNDPWVVAHVVGILYWVGAQRPLGFSPCGWDIMGCTPSFSSGLYPLEDLDRSTLVVGYSHV